MWNRWTTVIRDLKVPYGYTLGNHDSEADLRRREIVSVDMKNPYSLTELAPEELEQASTFVLPVYSSKNPEEVVMNLWFFDSGDYNCMGLKGYGCVGLNTVQWYREKSKELEEKQAAIPDFSANSIDLATGLPVPTTPVQPLTDEDFGDLGKFVVSIAKVTIASKQDEKEAEKIQALELVRAEGRGDA